MPNISVRCKKMRKRGSLLSLPLASMLVLSAAANPVFAEDVYRLRPQTQIKVNVIEWIAANGEYKEWTALNGEYAVSSVGTVSIPLIGDLPADGKSAADMAALIANTLKQQTGLAKAPVATVEVVRYPMVYVTGLVDRPGELEYKPGLTVMQAVAMAGGRQRRSNQLGGYSDLDPIRFAGDLSRIDLQLTQLAARKARLEAELNGRPSIVFPTQLTASPEGTPARQFMRDETILFDAREEALGQQMESLDELSTMLRNEIKVLEEKMATQDRQIGIAEKELESISRLVSSQTLAKTRETSTERLVAEMQSEKLDLVIAAMRARQKLSETHRDELTLKGQKRTDAGRELQTLEAESEDLKLKRNTTLQLLQMSGASLARYEGLRAMEFQALEYWLTRADGAGDTQKVEAAALIEPGDVLDVRYDTSATIDGTILSAIPGEQPLQN